jgi:hypothetical protein
VISREQAVALSGSAFPQGPEALSRQLNARVEFAILTGCEGWCIRRGEQAIIRINAASAPTRQRFTLAHELAHLILGTRPDVLREPFRSVTAEEKAADQLAGELLIPNERARAFLGQTLPIDAKRIERLALAANVSPIMAACRIVSMTTELGLKNAAVAFFDSDGRYKWRYSAGLTFTDDEASRLYPMVMASAAPLRIPNADGNTIVCSGINAQQYAALLLQLLPPDIAEQFTVEERTQQLRVLLFDGDYSFQQSVAASTGWIRNKHNHLTVDAALAEFDARYLQSKWTLEQRQRLLSPDGRQFLRLELAKSCRTD